ncbi:hypothetical protein [Streptomyces sp. NPDC000134]|uniref:hypothetical protein n=1 Tax=Streptomyces sp. NPDC000134 TaxID=3364536 RepID=UPI0036CCA71D
MSASERETYTTPEFGTSHEGAVGVLLADGTVPEPLYYDAISGPCGRWVSQWSAYDGNSLVNAPRAAALRAVCSCGWTGPQYPLDWDQIGDQDLSCAGAETAATCVKDWDAHTADVERSAISLPSELTALLDQVEEKIELLGMSSPLAALRAVRRLEVIAAQEAYWPTVEISRTADYAQAAAALGLNSNAARALVDRYRRSRP